MSEEKHSLWDHVAERNKLRILNEQLLNRAIAAETELATERRYHHIALKDKQHQIDNLREALEPFKKIADCYRDDIEGVAHVRLEDCRHAREALKETGNES